MQEMQVPSLGWEDPLEKERATHSSIPAWGISWTEEPGWLQSMGWRRVGHDSAIKQQQRAVPRHTLFLESGTTNLYVNPVKWGGPDRTSVFLILNWLYQHFLAYITGSKSEFTLRCRSLNLFLSANKADKLVEALLNIHRANVTKWCASHSVVSDSLRPHELHSPGNSPGQNTGVGSFSLFRGSSPPRNWTQVSHIAGGFFTSWATRKAQNTGVGSLSLLQWIFLDPGIELRSPAWQPQLSYEGSPKVIKQHIKSLSHAQCHIATWPHCYIYYFYVVQTILCGPDTWSQLSQHKWIHKLLFKISPFIFFRDALPMKCYRCLRIYKKFKLYLCFKKNFGLVLMLIIMLFRRKVS